MPKPTFSASITGALTGQLLGGAVVGNNTLIPDESVDGIALVNAGGQAYAMQVGSPVLARGPDGIVHWYRIRPHGFGGGSPTHPVLEFIGP